MSFKFVDQIAVALELSFTCKYLLILGTIAPETAFLANSRSLNVGPIFIIGPRVNPFPLKQSAIQGFCSDVPPCYSIQDTRSRK